MARDLQHQMQPPPWRQKWPPILAGLLWSVILILGTAWVMSEPAEKPAEDPLEITDSRAMIVERDGREVWRVELTVEVMHSCDAVVVNRQFLPADGHVRPHEPLYSYIDELGLRLGTAPYSVSIDADETPVLNVWHEYEIVPGERGTLLVNVSPHACENRYRGPGMGVEVPYDWRGR